MLTGSRKAGLNNGIVLKRIISEERKEHNEALMSRSIKLQITAPGFGMTKIHFFCFVAG